MVDLDADLVVSGVVEMLAVDGRCVDNGAFAAHAEDVADADGDDGVAFRRDKEAVVEEVASATAVSSPAKEMKAECAGLVDAVARVGGFIGDARVVLEIGVGPDRSAFPKGDCNLKEQEGEDDGDGDVHGDFCAVGGRGEDEGII